MTPTFTLPAAAALEPQELLPLDALEPQAVRASRRPVPAARTAILVLPMVDPFAVFTDDRAAGPRRRISCGAQRTDFVETSDTTLYRYSAHGASQSGNENVTHR